MAEPELIRLAREIESIYSRLRVVENAGTPRQQELVAELHEIRTKVSEMDVRGTAVTQERIGRIQDAVQVVSKKLDEYKEDVDDRFDKIDEWQTSIRTTMRSALITAALSIMTTLVGGIILWTITRNGS